MPGLFHEFFLHKHLVLTEHSFAFLVPIPIPMLRDSVPRLREGREVPALTVLVPTEASGPVLTVPVLTASVSSVSSVGACPDRKRQGNGKWVRVKGLFVLGIGGLCF